MTLHQNRLVHDLLYAGPDSAIHSLMQKDYPAMQKEKNYLRVKKVQISTVLYTYSIFMFG
jgi:hypothetical protein